MVIFLTEYLNSCSKVIKVTMQHMPKHILVQSLIELVVSLQAQASTKLGAQFQIN